ncbi:MAG: hypothetical protein IPM76_23225 [Chloroflexi bacterium]|nr:hypothetical protein [Chloroflexota bacterium]
MITKRVYFIDSRPVAERFQHFAHTALVVEPDNHKRRLALTAVCVNGGALHQNGPTPQIDP